MAKALATASRTKEIIEKWNLHARKGYGQNFLIDPSVAARIAESVGGPGAVIEIGPGKTIAGFVKKTIPEIPVINVSSVEDIAKVKEAING